MPQSKRKELLYALITVIITVPCFVFYCSSYEAGGFNVEVIKNSWIFIPIEFVLAYLSEIFIGGPLANKITFKKVNPKETPSMIVELVIIASTVLVMCPLMSFLATILYDGIINVGIYNGDFTNFLINFIPSWLQKIVLNFPFALLSQIFFIQPIVRTIFKKINRSKFKTANI